VLPLTKQIRTVSRGYRREKVVQTVTLMIDVPKEFAICSVNKSVNVKRRVTGDG